MATTEQASMTTQTALPWETPELIDLGSADDVAAFIEGAFNDLATQPTPAS
jgi:hypothetical protein